MWLTGRCISYGADISYVPIVDLIKDACGIEEADGETAIVAKLDAAVEAVGGEPANLPYLRYLLSVDPGDPAIGEQDPALRKARVFESSETCSSRPPRDGRSCWRSRTCIGSIRCRRSCCRSSSSALPDHAVLLLLTHRPDWEHPFGERPYYTRVRLPILSESDAISLAQAATGGAALPESLRATISLKTEGNPFFIEEVTRAVIEGGGTRGGRGHPGHGPGRDHGSARPARPTKPAGPSRRPR